MLYEVITGQTHAERISLGERHILHEPVISGDVPPGAPGEVRIGVWASGPELRLFLNDRFQFSFSDKNISSGSVGVFARATGDTPVTVAFSNLRVHAVEYFPPTSVITSYSIHYTKLYEDLHSVQNL